ncbi:alcohol acetyltransferase [Paramicrobacterium chengjingii]|uniref:Alcohol acetyltransferase n=1 Tax=Paramicrobacterium chengjingii TaxID=2769067 RepID=A0ABX6YH81_9MICO|nr:alcohol acetyltransferase [Microbacterium chengjingii]QPZ37954.1 alcohol acetyltransferase [Microbacterium chengjingii]
MSRGDWTRRNWVRLDNASNIFLAARSDSDPKVFRISAEMDHDVDPVLLQKALDATYDRYPLYHAVLRRGVFWYYLQDSDLRPRVTGDRQHTCSPIYQADRRNLLFRVMHHRQRVILEIFHALSDGTGALWFLTDLVTSYGALRYPEQPTSPDPSGAGPVAPDDLAQRDAHTPADESAEPTHGLVADSFAHYFRRRRRHEAPASESDFRNSRARPALGVPRRVGRFFHLPEKKVYRVRGTRTPDNRTRAVELTMPAHDVLNLARAEEVPLTMFLTALFFESIRLSAGDLGKARTLSASAPVNLRQFFPSTSPRNFFATVRVHHTYGESADDVGTICKQLDAQFGPKVSPEALEKTLRQFIRLEGLLVLRVIPRPLKDVILRLINWGNNRGLSIAVSNLGRVSLPESVDAHVGRMLFHVSAARPQICVMSHAGMLTISFTSPFVETDHIKEFARLLTDRGVAVTVAAARVTEEELAEAAL